MIRPAVIESTSPIRATMTTTRPRSDFMTEPTADPIPEEIDDHGPIDGADPSDRADPSDASVLESLRDAVEDLTERAGPTVRELTARSAEVAALAADRAGPFARQAGEVTADASIRLAERARAWATEIRASLAESMDAPSPGSSPDSGARDVDAPPPSEPSTSD
jgi:hypothetical protein